MDGHVWLRRAALICAALWPGLALGQQGVLPPAPPVLETVEQNEVVLPPGVENLPPGAPPAPGTGLSGPSIALDLIEFRSMPLGEAVRVISDQSDLKIVPSTDAAETLVSLYLKNIDALTAIDVMCKTHKLYYRQDRATGIIRIYTAEEYQADLGSFREEKMRVFTLLYPNPVDVAFAIQGLFGSRVQMNFGSMLAGDSLMSQDLQQRFSRFSIIQAFNQIANNTNSGTGATGGTGFGSGLSGGGFGSSGGSGFGTSGFGSLGGGGSGGFGTGFNGLLNGFGANNQQATQTGQQAAAGAQPIRDLTPDEIQQLLQGEQTPEGRAAVDELLRSRQALVYVTVIRRNNQLVVRTSDEKMMEAIAELVQKLDVPTPLVLLEVKVMALSLGDNFTSVFDYQFSDGSIIAGEFTAGNILAPFTNAGVPFDPLPKDIRREASMNIDNSPAGSDQDFTFQVVSSHFRARIQLFENNNRATTLATPLLLTAHNEVSQIFIGEQIPLVVGYNQGGAATGVGGTTTVQPSPQTQLTQVGQGLLITPNINADRTVTLRVSQQQSDVEEDGAVIPIVNSIGAIQELPIDVLSTRVVNGTVVAKDGLTVAIGGLIDENLTDNRAEVPVLGKLPVLGYFFRRQQTNRTRSELVILIRPYVFNTPAESAALSQELLPELSLHPNSPDGIGTLNTFNPPEVLRASAPNNKVQQIFRFHSLYPKTF